MVQNFEKFIGGPSATQTYNKKSIIVIFSIVLEDNLSKKNRKETTPITSSEKITIGDITGGTGIAIGTGASATVSQSTFTKDDPITYAFKSIEQALVAMPDGPHKEAADTVIKNLETEAHKGNQADETKIQRWMNFLAEIAPDIWEVAINTLSNPIKGVGVAFIKVARKAKKEATT